MDLSLNNLSASESLNTEIRNNPKAISVYKSAIKEAQESLYTHFDQGSSVNELVTLRSDFIDKILKNCWNNFFENVQNACLIAVGGYGRAELHPNSDVDILILFQTDEIDSNKDAIESFITFLWDIGLEIGSSVRTITECINEAQNDVTIATNLIEARQICGSDNVYSEFEQATSPTKIWSSKDFFEAKILEQKKRHNRFQDTAYNLEPNIKESPGGLRDIHMVGWITKRHFGDKCLSDLVTRGFLTDNELQQLLEGQNFLWKIRFALHRITGRREDRLLFEHQRELATTFGFKDEKAQTADLDGDNTSRTADGHRLAVEIFMKKYYRTIEDLSLLNEMLLQHYQETILYSEEAETTKSLNKRFQSINGFIEAKQSSTFSIYPFAMLEIFLLMQQNKSLKGIRGSTIRLMRESLHLIDQGFRDDIRCKSLFIEILKQPTGVTHQLRRMNRYGILGKYLAEFGKIIGQMQFDLFHAYTVDEHTLFVVRNIRRYSVEEFQHEFPLCSHLIKTIPKPELLYITGLYHDIAKGRGGDHSVLGEVDAREFCTRHGLGRYDTELVAWLVRNHLLMSATAQHKDLSDPDVINEFAAKVGNSIKLDYLYLLTVADIRATNDKLWNSWKDSLLKTLRHETKKALRRGLDNPLQKEDFIQQTQNAAIQLVREENLDEDMALSRWEHLGEDYFLRYTPQEILNHTKAIQSSPGATNIVTIDSDGLSGGTDVFLKTPISNNLFAHTTKALDTMNLDIVEAKIVTSNHNYSLNTYTVLEMDGEQVKDSHRLASIRKNILKAVEKNYSDAVIDNADVHRKVQCFIQPTEITFETDDNSNKTIMEIITTDRPGLLSTIASVLMHSNVQIENAKITTLGAQVDDVFIIYNENTGSSLSTPEIESLHTELINLLDCK